MDKNRRNFLKMAASGVVTAALPVYARKPKKEGKEGKGENAWEFVRKKRESRNFMPFLAGNNGPLLSLLDFLPVTAYVLSLLHRPVQADSLAGADDVLDWDDGIRP